MTNRFKMLKKLSLVFSAIGLVFSLKVFSEAMHSDQKVDTVQYYYSLAGIIVFSTILASCFLVWYTSKNNKN